MPERLIYRTISDEGVIEITQEQQQRSLYLGSDAKQSSMDLTQPHRLVLSYTRAMMSCLLFCPAPHTILLLGLGGGSLARFLRHHFPGCVIDAVELRADVVRLAHAYFTLPEPPNLEIFVAEAQAFLNRRQGRFERYDLIQVDAFNHDGVAETVKTEAFINACRKRLKQEGVFTINLWDQAPDEVRRTSDIIEQAFGNNILRLPVIDKGNLIIHAAPDKDTLQLASACKSTARRLEAALEMEFNGLLRQLRRANRWRTLGKFMGLD